MAVVNSTSFNVMMKASPPNLSRHSSSGRVTFLNVYEKRTVFQERLVNAINQAVTLLFKKVMRNAD